MSGYEEVRDSLDTRISSDWKAADREVASLTETYRSLQADPRYTEQHKSETAWKTFEEAKERIQESRKRVLKKLDAEAALEEHRSLPKPEGQSLHILKADTLLAAQQEANRVRRKLERLSEKRIGGSANLAQHLQNEYQQGLREGGLEGLCRCKATLMVADEYGVSHAQFLQDLREPYHHEALERARYYEQARGLIGKNIPEPPFPRTGRRVQAGEESNPFRKRAAS